MYTGKFFEREWTSVEDLSDLLSGNSLSSPLHAALVSACKAVEPWDTMPGHLAKVIVDPAGNGVYRVTASCCGKLSSACTSICEKCGISLFDNDHPWNGCSEVLIEEVHMS